MMKAPRCRLSVCEFWYGPMSRILASWLGSLRLDSNIFHDLFMLVPFLQIDSQLFLCECLD